MLGHGQLPCEVSDSIPACICAHWVGQVQAEILCLMFSSLKVDLGLQGHGGPVANQQSLELSMGQQQDGVRGGDT